MLMKCCKANYYSFILAVANLLDPRAHGCHQLEIVPKRVEPFLHRRKKGEGKHLFVEHILCERPFMHIVPSDPHINTGSRYYYCPTLHMRRPKLERWPRSHSWLCWQLSICDMLILDSSSNGEAVLSTLGKKNVC